MDQPSEEFFRICEMVGKKIPEWVQGPGGNVSEKAEGVLWVKASGIRLDTVSTRRKEGLFKGVSAVDLEEFKSGLKRISGEEIRCEDLYSRLLQSCCRSGARPSMETGFHALLDSRYVIHFHSLAAVLMAHYIKNRNKDWEDFWASQKLIKRGDITFIDITSPGFELANQVFLKRFSQNIVLENHGLVLQANSVDELIRWEKFEKAFYDHFDIDLNAYQNRLTSGPIKIYFPDSAVFYRRFIALVEKRNGFFFSLLPGCDDKDALELWQATQLLYNISPDLKELPEDVSRRICDLPTEHYRQNLGDNRCN